MLSRLGVRRLEWVPTTDDSAASAERGLPWRSGDGSVASLLSRRGSWSGWGRGLSQRSPPPDDEHHLPGAGLPGDFPDPSVLLASGQYWAYATGSGGLNLQVMSSSDLRSWTTPVDPLPVLPSWASSGHTWAPDVMAIGGQFVMYYAVRDSALNIQCVSVATSATAGGPFSDGSSGPLVCQTPNGGSIDANPYLDPESGNRICCGRATTTRSDRRPTSGGSGSPPAACRFIPVPPRRCC